MDIPVYQYQGTRIAPTASPVASLEGPYQAMIAGRKSGMETPSTAGAIAQGLTGAYEAYVKSSAVQAEIEQAKASTAFTNARTAQMLDGNPTQQEQTELALKKEQLATAQSKNQKETSFQALGEAISTGDPSQLKGYLDPRNPSSAAFMKVLFDNYKEAPGILGLMASRLGNDREASQMLNALSNNIKRYDADSSKKSLDDIIKSSAIKSGTVALNSLNEKGILQTYFPNAKSSADVFSASIFPQGLKKHESGKIDMNIADNPEAASKDEYDLFSKDGNYLGTLDKDTANKFAAAKTAYNYQIEDINTAVYGPDGPPQEQAQETQVRNPGPTADSKIQGIEGDKQRQQQSTILGGNNGVPASQANPNIVSQTKQYNNTTRAVNGKSIDARLLAQSKQKYEQQFKVTPVPTVTAKSPTPLPNINSGGPVPVPTPTQTLQAITKEPVKLNISPKHKSVDEAIYGRVLAEPLLMNESALIKGLASVESKGIRNNISPTNVKGLLMVSQATARDFGYNRDIPSQNVAAGKAYLDFLWRQPYLNKDPRLILAAYNAGQGTIKDAIDNTGSHDWEDIKGYLKDKLSEFQYGQVEDYPDRVIDAASHYLNPDDPNDQIFVGILSSNGLLTTA